MAKIQQGNARQQAARRRLIWQKRQDGMTYPAIAKQHGMSVANAVRLVADYDRLLKIRK